MKLTLRLISALLIAGVTIFTQTGCKEHTLIDAKVAPNIDNIHVFQTDTFTVLTKTIIDDSLETSNSISGIPIYHGLGSILGTNPTFGNTTEGIYLQVIPEIIGPTFLSTPSEIVDSAALILPYGGYSFGNTSTPVSQSFYVYEINDTSFSNLNGYQAVNPVPYSSAAVGSITGVNMQNLINDSVMLDGLYRRPMLRIMLDISSGSQLFKTLQIANQQSDILSFQKIFNGLYIAPDTSTLGTNLLPYFQLDGVDTYSRAAILVYHHNPSTAGEQIFQYYFDLQTCAHYNRITRNYSGYPAQLLASKNSSDTVALIQNLPGLAIDVKVPYLNNAFDQSKFKFIINSAQLIITQINTGSLPSSIFAPNVKMTVTGVGGPNNDSLYIVADQYPLSSSYASQFLGGDAKQVTVGGITTNQYTLNLPREIMESIAKKRTLHVRINGTIDYPGSMQTVIGGGNNPNPNYKMKLNIIYTKI